MRSGSRLRPWVDLIMDDTSILPELAAILGPGGSLMVAYEGDATERCLRRRVPPAATPLGLVMVQAGCTWFKNWYFPEGGNEGGTKLQGTLPLDDEHRKAASRRLINRLEDYLDRVRPREEDRERVRQALHQLRPQASGG